MTGIHDAGCWEIGSDRVKTRAPFRCHDRVGTKQGDRPQGCAGDAGVLIVSSCRSADQAPVNAHRLLGHRKPYLCRKGCRGASERRDSRRSVLAESNASSSWLRPERR
jgi:hypothetical protein